MIRLKNHIISIDASGEYTFITLPEELCREMCDVIDKGDRYSPSSRYNYVTEYFSETNEGFSFGTAVAAVKYVIMKKLRHKRGNRIKIEKIT